MLDDTIFEIYFDSKPTELEFHLQLTGTEFSELKAEAEPDLRSNPVVTTRKILALSWQRHQWSFRY